MTSRGRCHGDATRDVTQQSEPSLRGPYKCNLDESFSTQTAHGPGVCGTRFNTSLSGTWGDTWTRGGSRDPGQGQGQGFDVQWVSQKKKDFMEI